MLYEFPTVRPSAHPSEMYFDTFLEEYSVAVRELGQ